LIETPSASNLAFTCSFVVIIHQCDKYFQNGYSDVAKMSTSKLDDPRFGALAVIERLKEVFGVTSDAALAEKMNVPRQRISKWKIRNSIPYLEAVEVSFSRNVSLDYLLAGEGAEARKLRGPSELDAEVVRAILLNLVGFGLLDVPRDRELRQALDDAARAIVFQYSRAQDVIRELVSRSGLKPDDARSAAILATEKLGSDGSVFSNWSPSPGSPRSLKGARKGK
jgi:hypothetical protein